MCKDNRVNIRKFKRADLAEIKSLIDRTIETCYSGIYCEEAVKFFKDWHSGEKILNSAKKGYTIILEKDGRIIGTGTIVCDEIVRVFVAPAYQNRGFGKLLMKRLENIAHTGRIETVRLDASLPSKKFYDSLGYVALEKTFRAVENHKKLDYYKMQKVLI